MIALIVARLLAKISKEPGVGFENLVASVRRTRRRRRKPTNDARRRRSSEEERAQQYSQQS